MIRHCFYSFQYQPDNSRAALVRNIGTIEGNKPARDNDWETVKRGGDTAIKRWINGQMKGRSCTVLLVGEHTAGRKWINYEIERSWEQGMGIVGIHIHGLKDLSGRTASKGRNPFNGFTLNPSGKSLSSVVKCYDPAGTDSKARYGWIARHLSNAVEEAIKIRKSYT